MTQTTDTALSGFTGQPLSGRKLYAPAVIAVYTALANLPIGIILYGINHSARGKRRLGRAMVAFGIAAFRLLILLGAADALPRLSMLVGIAGAINVYKLEQRPFEEALRQGAIRATVVAASSLPHDAYSRPPFRTIQCRVIVSAVSRSRFASQRGGLTRCCTGLATLAAELQSLAG